MKNMSSGKNAEDIFMKDRLFDIMVSWWDVSYRIFAPWDTDKPPKELVELVKGKSIEPCRVLDVGCGTGNYAFYLASQGFETVGIDKSDVAIKKARKKVAEKNVDCRFHTLDFLDVKALSNFITKPFDLVIDYGCLHSINGWDRMWYPVSLKYVTHPRSLYLLWAFRYFLKSWDVKMLFSNDFRILEKKTTTRWPILHILERK